MQKILRNILVTIVAFVIIFIASNWKWALFISSVFFIIQYFKSARWDRFYITRLKIIRDVVSIGFIDNGEEHYLEGKLNDFEFKKKVAFDRTKTVYLAIYYKNELLVKQFEIGEWNEAKFDEIQNVINHSIEY